MVTTPFLIILNLAKLKELKTLPVNHFILTIVGTLMILKERECALLVTVYQLKTSRRWSLNTEPRSVLLHTARKTNPEIGSKWVMFGQLKNSLLLPKLKVMFLLLVVAHRNNLMWLFIVQAINTASHSYLMNWNLCLKRTPCGLMSLKMELDLLQTTRFSLWLCSYISSHWTTLQDRRGMCGIV